MADDDRPALPRRHFLRTATAGVAGLALAAPALLAAPIPLPPAAGPDRRSTGETGRGGTTGRRPGPRRGQEPWARLEPVAPGAWAVVSTPLAGGDDARRTLCNGGIVAGRTGVLAVEGFATAAGAAWLAGEAERLAGMRPTHVVLTHVHGDHTSGTAGYLRGAPGDVRVLATETTRRLLAEAEARLPAGRATARQLLLPDTLLPDAGDPIELDLGGRTVRLHAMSGHTASDLVVELADGVVFAGDLVWNGMFPNYVDAIPSRLAASVRRLRGMQATTWVSGHGDLAGAADLDRYVALLDDVEAAARRALEAGTPLDRAGAEYRVPERLGAWHMFSPRYPEVAFRAWARETGA